MSAVRLPAVAGMFYPGERAQLERMLQGFLAPVPDDPASPLALIAPHAGYVYSGPVAASAYACLRHECDRIRRVVLLGPSHRVAFAGIAASGKDAFLTPLGPIPLDREAVELLLEMPFVVLLETAHEGEHSLEVHLPFLQTVLGAFTLVPLVVGEASPEEVEAVIEKLWDGAETLFVISSDLSHYHDYETAREMDRRTSDAIEALRPEEIGFDQACGRVPIHGLLRFARRRGLRARTVDVRNSGDTAGPRDQVVGYGAYVFT